MNVRRFLFLPVVVWCCSGLILVPGTSSHGQGLLAKLFRSSTNDEDSETSFDGKWSTPRLLIPLETEESILHWVAGEALEGTLHTVTDGVVHWESDLFAEPLRIQLRAIERLDQEGDYQAPKGSCRVVLTNGSLLIGELSAVGDGALTLKDTCAGEVAIGLDQVVSLEHRGPSMPQTSPQAFLADLPNAPSSHRRVALLEGPLWMAATGGRIATPSINRKLQMDAPDSMPKRGMLWVKFKTDSAPNFSIEALGLRLETWADELVLAEEEATFVSAGEGSVSESARDVDLRWCWDHAAKQSVVYDAQGKAILTLSDIAIEPDNNLHFQPRHAGTLLERWVIREWDGKPPGEVPSDVPFADGLAGITTGTLIGREGDELLFATPDGATERVALAAFSGAYWPREPALEAEDDLTDIWYADGQLLRGNLTEGNTFALDIEGVPEALSPSLTNVRTLVIAKNAREQVSDDPTTHDQLIHGDRALRGRIGFHGGKTPKFFPLGSEDAVTLDPEGDWRLQRHVGAPDETTMPPALIHFGDGESIPGKLVTIENERVTFSWEGSEASTLTVSQIHAVQALEEGKTNVGFESPLWYTTDKRRQPLDRDDNGLTLPPGARIANDHAMRSGDVRFGFFAQSGSASIRIRITPTPEERGSGANFLIANYGEIYAGVEQGTDSGQFNSNKNFQVDRSKPAPIRIHLKDKTVFLSVAENECGSVRLDEENAPLTIVIENTPVWGNQASELKLADFMAEGDSFRARSTAYRSKAKEEALLLPRLLRDSPPRHILIGRNGDLLRGTIEAMTSTHLAFRTGLESLNVPRERVAAIIWPDASPKDEETDNEADEPDKEPETEEPSGRQWLDFTNGGRLGFVISSWTEEWVTGTHPVLGDCRIPTTWVYQTHLKNPGSTSAHASLADWHFTHTPDPVLTGEEGTSSPLVGQEAPDFTLTTLDEKAFTLAETKGKVVVLDFWATWCGPCVRSLPELIETMATFDADDVVFMTIDQGESADRVNQFLEARQWQMPVALDPNQQVGGDYGATSIPHTVVIDAKGTISFVKSGFTADAAEQIAAAVREALEER